MGFLVAPALPSCRPEKEFWERGWFLHRHDFMQLPHMEFGTVASVMTISFINKWVRALERPVTPEKTRLTSLEFQTVTSNA